jgi:DNA-binding MarR family transcriptional regulator
VRRKPAARARERTGGQPARLSPDQVLTARQLYEQQDMTVAQIGDVLGVSRTTVYRALRRESKPDAGRHRKTSG